MSLPAGHRRPLLPQGGTVHRGEAQRLRQGALWVCCCAGCPDRHSRRQVWMPRPPSGASFHLCWGSDPIFIRLSRMDSFFLAEMFKYLYLLFSEKSQLPIDIDDYVFTTEAHLLPVSLSTTRPSCQGNNTVRAEVDLFSHQPKHPPDHSTLTGLPLPLRRPFLSFTQRICSHTRAPAWKRCSPTTRHLPKPSEMVTSTLLGWEEPSTLYLSGWSSSREEFTALL